MIGYRAQVDAVRVFARELAFVLGEGRKRLPVMLVLMLGSTALDLLGVVLIAPFLGLVVAAPENRTGTVSWLQQWGLNDLAAMGVLLLAVFVAKGYAAYRVQRRITTVTEGERARLMTRLMRAFQSQPYEFHLARNSTDLINTVVWFTQAFTAVLSNLLRMVADGMVFLALVAFLAWTDPRAVAVLVTVLAIVFLGVTRAIRARMGRVVQDSARLNAEVMHSVGQALGALREVRILGRETYFRDRLSRAAQGLVNCAAAQSSLQLVPRQAIEVAMVAFLVVLVWIAHSAQGHAQNLIPVLGTFAAAAVRLMPASTSLLSSWNNMRANRFAVAGIAKELRDEPDEASGSPAVSGPVQAEPFSGIELDAVGFSYRNAAEPAVRDVSLKIAAGDVIGVMGKSGAGKSTLADLVLGLLTPQLGEVRVNGWNVHDHLDRWHRMVAYIPQTVYLLDDSLRRNIALGVPDGEIDEERVRHAITSAQLDDLVGRLEHGLDTEVGERGVRLSGGQRQRVAIARALYHQRQFLVLDEATSALDAETERAVVAAIGALAGRVTMLIIAHRESTLVGASRILEMRNARIV